MEMTWLGVVLFSNSLEKQGWIHRGIRLSFKKMASYWIEKYLQAMA